MPWSPFLREERDIRRTQANIRAVTAALALLLAALLVTCSPSRDRGRPNVILIVLDAVRAGNLGCYGHFRDTSPNIDRLASRGVLFEDAVTQAPWTKASFASFLTSRYPFQHGISDWTGVLPDSIETLAGVLGGDGYGTVCVVNMLAMAGRFKVLKGFDTVSEAGRGDRGARRTTDDAIDLIDGYQEPFFLLVHYFDPHAPYAPPIEYADLVRRPSDPDPASVPAMEPGDLRGIPSSERIDRQLLLYDGCIRFADDNIGRLLAYLEEAGIRDRTIIIVTADHGEEFYEHGVSGHGANVFDYAIRVPLIIDFPGEFEGGKRISRQVRLIDIFPTVLELTGTDPGEALEGYSLVGPADRGEWPPQGDRLFPPQMVLSECSVRRTLGTKCLRTDRWKAIVEPLTSADWLYDLGEDPRETRDVWAENREVGEGLLARLKQIPGVSLGGWRLAFTGGRESGRVRVKAGLAGSGRFTDIQKVTRGGDIEISADADSSHLMVDAALDRLQMITFETEPEGAAVNFKFEREGPAPPGDVAIGSSTRHGFGETVAIDPTSALGLPRDFSEQRERELVGAYLWWLPGEKHKASAQEVTLTPEEKRRLRALGYLQ
jgi:arylsulfatase A-like enzyme